MTDAGRARRRVVVPIPALALLLAFLLTALTTLDLATTVRQVGRAAALVSRTHEVVERADTVLSTLKDAETGQRGYLLTGDARYLAPYESAITTVPASIRQLEDAVSDNAAQQRRVTDIRVTAAAKLAELGQTVRLARQGRREAALTIVSTDQGRELMNRLRRDVAAFQSEERRLLAERESALEHNQRAALRGALVASVGAVAAAVLAAYLLFLRGRRAEAAVVKSDRRLRATYDNAGVGICELDADGHYVAINETFTRLTGYTLGDLAGRTAFDMIEDQAERVRARERFEQLKTGDVASYVEERPYARAEGGRWIAKLRTTVVRGAAGRFDYAVSILEDVTERRQDEAESRHRLAQLHSIYEGVPVGLASLDRDLRFLEANQYFASINGLPVSDLIGGRLSDVLPDAAATIVPLKRHVINTGESAVGVEIRSRTPASQEERDFLTSYTPICDAHGQVSGVTVAVLDITDRKQAEEEVRRLNRDLESLVEARTRRLEELNAELQSFTYSVSHDLRAPLRAMEGFSQALAEDYGERLDTQGQNYLNRIVTAARQMDTLITDLLDYSRLTREDIRLGPVPLEGAVDAALRQLGAMLSEKAAVVDVERPLPVVQAQGPILVQAIANLLSNAIKFVAPGVHPMVRVRAEHAGERVRLWVEDNGIGIAPDHQVRIFEVFQRLHGGGEYPGTGIGLAIVRKSVERMGGTLGVESVPGQGSRFWIDLAEGANR